MVERMFLHHERAALLEDKELVAGNIYEYGTNPLRCLPCTLCLMMHCSNRNRIWL